MPVPGFGHASYVQIAREAAWGTALAATRRFQVASVNARPERAKIRSETLHDTVNRKAIFSGPQRGMIDLELELDFEGQLHLWDAAFGTGAYAANGATVTGANPYTWILNQRMLANSLCCQEIRGDIPAGKCNRVVGAKVNTFSISGASGFDAKPLRLKVGLVGKSFETNVTPTGALTAAVANPVMFHHIDTANFKSGTADAAGLDRLRAFEFSLNNHLTEDRYYGADTQDEMLRNDYAETQFKWTLEFATRSAIDEYMANTAGAPIIKFVAPVGTKSIQISMPVGYIVTPVGVPVDKWGVLLQEFTYEAVDDGAGTPSGARVTIVNAEATLT